jgi:hypothetical protein
MRRPYLKPLPPIGRGVACYLVDGRWVRDRYDVEFTNGAHHLTRPYVPPDEVWIDREAPGAGELRFLLRHQVRHRALMLEGKTYHQALRHATLAEKRERRAALKRPDLPLNEARHAVRRVLIGTVDELRAGIWLVDGRGVRDRFYPEFTLGGHGLRYRFIPRGEIWIDDAVIEEERAEIIAHEVLELRLMRTGMSYPDAHRRASALEKRLRRRRAGR